MSLEGKNRAILLIEELSNLLCREDEFACTLRPKYDSSCMVRVKSAVTSSGDSVSLEDAEKYVTMCDSCLAYWLNLRLLITIRKLS